MVGGVQAVLGPSFQKRTPVLPHFTSRRCRPMDVVRSCVELTPVKSGDMVGDLFDQVVQSAYIKSVYGTQLI